MSTLQIAGGHVLRPDFSVERADVLIDQEAGTILAVGSTVPEGDEILDATDGVVLPGLVNAHSHVAMTLLRGYADDKPVSTWLEKDIWPVEAALTPADIRAGTELGLLEMIRSGTTAFCDMYFEMESVAAAVEQAGLRARLGYGVITVGKDPAETTAELERGLRVARDLDRRADGRIRSAFMPHALTTVDGEALESVLPQVRSAGIPVHYHANESPPFVDPILEETGKRPLAYAQEMGLLEPGDWIAHAVHLDASEIALLADREVSVIHCPASNMKLASGIAPVQRLHEAGVTVGIGTDGAASNNALDMVRELRLTALLGKLADGEASAVPARTAVRMATVDGARAIGLPYGTLKAGGVADLAVVDFTPPHLQPTHDYVSNLTYAATGGDVRHTICDGTILMRDRTVETLDAEEVINRANQCATALIDRAQT